MPPNLEENTTVQSSSVTVILVKIIYLCRSYCKKCAGHNYFKNLPIYSPALF
jgi:hypothetical protein